MGANLMKPCKKLITALNQKGYNLTFSQKEFMGNEGIPHKMYSVNKATFNEEKRKYDHKELYSTTSLVRMVLYLRDLWYLENGLELPTDQELWNGIREKLREDGKLG